MLRSSSELLVARSGGFVYHYGTGSWRFRLDSSDNIEIRRESNVSRRQVMEVMGSDIDRNVFFMPLDDRKSNWKKFPG